MLSKVQYDLLIEFRQSIQARRDVAQSAVKALRDRIAAKRAELPALVEQEAAFDTMTDEQRVVLRDQRRGIAAAKDRIEREILQLDAEAERLAAEAERFRQQLGLFYVQSIQSEMKAHEKAHGR